MGEIILFMPLAVEELLAVLSSILLAIHLALLFVLVLVLV
jgi:hypothetical protein